MTERCLDENVAQRTFILMLINTENGQSRADFAFGGIDVSLPAVGSFRSMRYFVERLEMGREAAARLATQKRSLGSKPHPSYFAIRDLVDGHPSV